VIRSILATTLLVLVLLGGAVSIAQEYTIGPGDVLKITVWGHDDLSKDYPVTLDGRVPFPLIGAVQAAGLTTSEFASASDFVEGARSLGKVTSLRELRRQGDGIWVTGPLGIGFTAPERGRPLLVGGGIGAAPLLCWRDELGPDTTTLLGFRSAQHAEAMQYFPGGRVATDDGSGFPTLVGLRPRADPSSPSPNTVVRRPW